MSWSASQQNTELVQNSNLFRKTLNCCHVINRPSLLWYRLCRARLSRLPKTSKANNFREKLLLEVNRFEHYSRPYNSSVFTDKGHRPNVLCCEGLIKFRPRPAVNARPLYQIYFIGFIYCEKLLCYNIFFRLVDHLIQSENFVLKLLRFKATNSETKEESEERTLNRWL